MLIRAFVVDRVLFWVTAGYTGYLAFSGRGGGSGLSFGRRGGGGAGGSKVVTNDTTGNTMPGTAV